MGKLNAIGNILCGLSLLVFSNVVNAQYLDSTINYFIQGRIVSPWELSLQFGQVKLDGNSGKTAKGSLIIEPVSRNSSNDAVALTWKPKGIKTKWGSVDVNVMTMNIINTQAHIDLSSVKKDVAIAFDIKVIKKPKELVNLSIESNWDWKTRSSFALKQVLNRLPENEWVTVPIPLICFDNGKIEYDKLTTIFMLQTAGKMKVELGDVRLMAYPADKVTCPS